MPVGTTSAASAAQNATTSPFGVDLQRIAPRRKSVRTLNSEGSGGTKSLTTVATADDSTNRTTELQRYVVNKIELLKRTQFSIKKVTQLCSFIPDFILVDEVNRKIPYMFSFEAVVLMADISGFTALTEAYSLRGKGGTDQLTKTLAGYIGPLAECILQAEGDIVKYAGDAFLAYWRSNPDDYPEDVQRVVDCALFIQEKYGSHLCKEVDITIRVKIGIGAGIVHFSGIGTETYQHWVAFGPGVRAASDAEKYCVSGDVVLHPSAWAYCTPSNYRFAVKESPFIHMFEIVNFINFEKRGRPLQIMHTSRGGKKSEFVGAISTETDLEKIRPQIAGFVEKKSEAIMRPFVIPPILRKLDDDIPVDYLNESRVVCICFIAIKTDEKVDQDEKNFRENTATIVQKAFVKIYVNVTKLQGALSKVIMFDKGLTYLVVFGLPGYINENQSAHALKFAYRTRLALKTIRFVTDVSIGVTTGSCYCGVIGHPRRQEYTVIGRKVNKAARLMVYYPGRLTCDQDTAYFSKLPLDNFKLMEAKELKGIKDVGNIYEFVNADTSDDNAIPFFEYPLLGREAELAYFKNALVRTQKELEQMTVTHNMTGTLLHRTLGMGHQDAQTQKGIWMIIFEGDNGVGKSRMLAACIQEAENLKIQAFTVGMTLASSSQQFFALSCLVIDALGMLDLRTVQEREEYLRKHVTDAELVADLCLLNDILHTKFPMNPKYTALDVNASHTYGQHVLSSLLKATYPTDVIFFAVDDGHHMDFRSWEYLVYLSKFPNVFTLCSLRRSNAGSPKLADSVNKQIYHNRHIKIIRISGLEPKFVLPLACQIMQCKAVPADLERMILTKSNGVPAWISQVLNELLRVGTIRMQEDSILSKSKQALVYAEKSYLEKLKKAPKKTFRRWAQEEGDDITITPTAHTAHSGLAVKEVKEDINPLDRYIVIKSDTDINKVKVSGTLKEIVLDALDELQPAEQIILKAATVLGVRFSRQMLTRLLPQYEKSARKYDQCFNHLMEAKYFRCASGTAKQKEQASAINAKPQCFCREEEFSTYQAETDSHKTMTEMPKYYKCRFMEFMKENMVDVVYEVMTEDQRTEFHLKAAKYYDSSIIRCENCGGEDRSYLFGFSKKANDYSVDTEESLRMPNQSKRAVSKTHIRNETQRLSDISYHSGERRKRTLVTQLEGLKKTYESNGTRIGNIELDILKGLMEYDRREHERSCWRRVCCRFKREEKELEEEEEEIRKFEMMEKGLHPYETESTVALKTSEIAVPTSGSISAQDNAALLHGSSSNQPDEPHTTERSNSYYMIDLRMCQCAILQAKICVEMVFHYREAKKYGRCLQNLLDAAESDVTVGNGTQALVHIEDAVGLLYRVKLGELTAPDRDDQDDSPIDDMEAEAQIEFLSGLAYFEIGVAAKAREYFLKALQRLGLVIVYDESGVKRNAALFRAKLKLCRVRKLTCCSNTRKVTRVRRGPHFLQIDVEDDIWKKKIRILSYLHSLFKSERKIEMALLVTLWQIIIAEQYGDIVHDVIPAYSNMMDCYSALSKHREAKKYERYSLELIRTQVGMNDQVEPMELITGANLFLNIATSRLNRGEIESSVKASYLAFRIAQSIHDNGLIVRILPELCHALLLSLRIAEVAEALQRLWFLAEEADDWMGVSSYYALCMDLLLNTAYPLEQFGVCENFISHSDWATETSVYRDGETQYSMEASMALWYARYSRWDQAQKWFTEAESHKPKHHSFVTVNSELKLLECQLIVVNHYLDSKRYQHFAKARNSAKELMRTLTKATLVVPVLKPRFIHLMAYYYRIRSRNVEAEKQLKAAGKLAVKMGNSLEEEWITHSRTVWTDLAIPTIKYFWLEHTENHTLDWHSSGKIPWANIMYSLPLPAWK